jgi:hypothetical protein
VVTINSVLHCGEQLPTDVGNRHTNNGDTPRAGAHRPRRHGRQPVAHQSIEHRIREAVRQHVGHRTATRGAGEQAERPALIGAWFHSHPHR